MEQLPNPTPDKVHDLYRDFLEMDEDGSSSNDVVQMLDDWFTDNGFPTVLYRERKRKGGRR